MVAICATAFLASGLTLFSGFGLGTLLMPAMAVFFPAPLAVALTALVHLANNVFKLALLGRRADPGVLARFGVPAVFGAWLGAKGLVWLSALSPLARYELAGRILEVTPVKTMVGALLLAFVALELSPLSKRLTLPRRLLPLGGLASGVFGGLSGHQGALRSIFLIKAGLSKEAFIATGVASACLVDAARLTVYARHFSRELAAQHGTLLFWASASALAGSFLGSRLLEKIEMKAIRRIVATMLLALAAALIAGVV